MPHTHAPRSRFTSWPMAGLLLAVAACCAVVVLAWAPAFTAPYQYDDYVTPVKDPASQNLQAFATYAPQTLRPLTKLTYALESSLGATEAPTRRVVQIALLLACVLLLAACASTSGLPLPAPLLLATLWGVHPVHAETVVALAGRSVLLSLVLILASALFLLRDRPGSALACAVLAVLARETSILWLVVCAAAVGSRLSSGKRHRAQAAAAALLSCIGGLALLLSSHRLRALVAYAWNDTQALDRLGLQWAAIPAGLWALFTSPASFAVDIDFNVIGAARAALVVTAFALVGAAAWLALSRRFQPGARVAAALWLALTLPTQSVVPKLDPFTARTVSAGSVGVALLCAAACVWWNRVKPPSARARGAAVALGALLIFAVVPMTRARAALYQDPVELWRDAAVRSSTRTRPLVNLATLLAQRGALDAARGWLIEAARRSPHDVDIRERIAAVDALVAARGARASAVQ